MGVIVVLTVTPFVSTSSSSFLNGVENSLFIRELSRGESLAPVDEHDSAINKIIVQLNHERMIPPALTSYKVSKASFSTMDE